MISLSIFITIVKDNRGTISQQIGQNPFDKTQFLKRKNELSYKLNIL